MRTPWFRFCLLALAVTGVPRALAGPGDIVGASMDLDIEVLLVDQEGIHPQRRMTASSDRLGEPSMLSRIRLGPEGTSELIFRVDVAFAGGDLKLHLERELRRPGGNEKLPALDHRMSVLDSWRTTLLPDNGAGGRLDLRVVALIGQEKDDQVLDARNICPRVSGGALVELMPPGKEDRVIFSNVYTGGAQGLMFGIPGLGVAKLSHIPFLDAQPCGSVQGSSMGFHLGNRDFVVYSMVPILPEYLGLPTGKGWQLFGLVEPEKPGQLHGWGGFKIP